MPQRPSGRTDDPMKTTRPEAQSRRPGSNSRYQHQQQTTGNSQGRVPQSQQTSMPDPAAPTTDVPRAEFSHEQSIIGGTGNTKRTIWTRTTISFPIPPLPSIAREGVATQHESESALAQASGRGSRLYEDAVSSSMGAEQAHVPLQNQETRMSEAMTGPRRSTDNLSASTLVDERIEDPARKRGSRPNIGQGTSVYRGHTRPQRGVPRKSNTTAHRMSHLPATAPPTSVRFQNAVPHATATYDTTDRTTYSDESDASADFEAEGLGAVSQSTSRSSSGGAASRKRQSHITPVPAGIWMDDI